MSSYGVDATIKTTSGVVFSDLGFTSDTDFDTYIATLNAAASERVNSYCRRDFDLHTAESVKQRGSNSFTMTLPFRPVISITSIARESTTVDSDDYQIKPVPNSPYNSGAIENFYQWWYKVYYYTTVFNWGYSTPPADIIQVTEQLVRSELQRMSRKFADGEFTSLSFGGYSISIGDGNSTDAATLSQLDRYRAVVL